MNRPPDSPDFALGHRITRRTCLRTFATGLVASPLVAFAGQTPSQLQEPESPFEPRLHLKLRDSVSGDAHPFFHKGEWHLFFLGDRFEVHRATSRNLLDWTLAEPIHLDRLQRADISPYYVLGIVRDEATDRFRTWYGRRGTMVCQESQDLTHWTRADTRYDISPQTRYAQQRDPYVLWNEDESQWWCVMTSRIAGESEGKDGAIAFASSSDLRDWQPRGDLLFPGNIGAPEVPQLAKLFGRWYLFASLLSPRRVGPASYWIGESSSGPWSTPSPPTLDGEDLAAMNYGFDGQRWIGIGWIPQHDLETHGKDTWGGHFGLARELFPLENGRLGVRLPDELYDALFGAIKQDLAGLQFDSTGAWQRAGQRVIATQSATLRLPESHPQLALTTTFERREGSFGIRWLRPDQEIADEGVRPRLAPRLASDPSIDCVELLLADDRWVFRARVQEGKSSRVIELSSIATRTDLQASVEHSCQLVIEQDIAEAFLDGDRSLAARLPVAWDSFQLELFTQPAPNSQAVDLELIAFELRELKRRTG